MAFSTVIAWATSAAAQGSRLTFRLVNCRLVNWPRRLLTRSPASGQLQFQFNNFKLETRTPASSGKWVNNLYFQPVMPVSLTKDWNLITRPVIALYQSVPHPTTTGSIERTTHSAT